ncbi:MAG: hypothetical protein ACP5IL_14250 [Syntrophobacteraceae bacterium]
MRCDQCGAELSGNDAYMFAGQTLCEDCYINRMATPKTCDPWAVYTAKRSQGKDRVLTPLQQKIYDFIAEQGAADIDTICSKLSITEDDFRAAFATLRHMELSKASKEGNKIIYTLFDPK